MYTLIGSIFNLIYLDWLHLTTDTLKETVHRCIVNMQMYTW